MPNICKEQSCEEKLRRRDHYLCRTHWDMSEGGAIDECPECGAYKDSGYEYCISCNKKNSAKSTRKKKSTASNDSVLADMTL